MVFIKQHHLIMTKKYFILIGFLSLFLFSCNKNSSNTIDKSIIGKWIELYTIDDIDTGTYLAPIDPAIYEFKKSGNYNYSVISSNNDTLKANGTWCVDSLSKRIIFDEDNDKIKAILKYKILNDSILFLEDKMTYGPKVKCYIAFKKIL